MSSSNAYPGWAYLLAGVAMGLFIAFLVYLKNLPEQDTATVKAKPGQQDTPKFDFYTILPELEVVIPDTETDKIADKPKQNEDRKNTSAPAKLADDENFVLQVGSFKDVQQADKLKASLALIGLEAHIQKIKVDSSTWHRVRLGPFTDRKLLNSVKQRLKENRLHAITLKVSG